VYHCAIVGLAACSRVSGYSPKHATITNVTFQAVSSGIHTQLYVIALTGNLKGYTGDMDIETIENTVSAFTLVSKICVFVVPPLDTKHKA
jgi:hypothetical protein